MTRRTYYRRQRGDYVCAEKCCQVGYDTGQYAPDTARYLRTNHIRPMYQVIDQPPGENVYRERRITEHGREYWVDERGIPADHPALALWRVT